MAINEGRVKILERIVADKLVGPLHYIFKEVWIMKDFLIKHPIISFLALDTVVCGLVNIVTILKTGRPVCRIQIGSKTENNTETKED